MPGLFAPAPAIAAVPPLHGLTSAAQEVQSPERWQLGFTTCPENCVDVTTIDPSCWSWPDGEKPDLPDAEPNQACYDVEPFDVITAFQCDAQGHAIVDYAGRARRQLEAGTPKALEYELWTGAQKPGNPNLQTGATVIGGGSPYPMALGLSLLGQALANCAHGGVGVIHAPTWVVSQWLDLGSQVKEAGNRLVTVVRGDAIVAGSGYPSTGPDGIAAGNLESWVFATGPVNVRLGEPEVFPDTLKEALNIRTNDVEYRSQRLAAVNFDPCCHFAILLTADPDHLLGTVSV